MPKLKLSFLGSPQIKHDGRNVEIGASKAVALLAYLAVTGQNHGRDTLSTFLWPDSDQSRARTYLRHVLWSLKKELGEDWLQVSRAQVGLRSDTDLWLDTAAFQAGIMAAASHDHTVGQICPGCLEQLQEAVSLFRDNFLAGFTLPDSPAFDEWQFFQAEELRQLLATALERLVQEYTERQEYESAIVYARRRLSLDALHESAHRVLMRLYALAGQQAAALRQYQECARLLDEELGVEPEAETNALYEAVRTRQLGPIDFTPTAFSAPSAERYQLGAAQHVPALDRQAILSRTAEAESHGNYTAAIDLLRPLLLHNAADEAVHRNLMRLFALNGRRHEALRQYHICLSALAARGAQPQPETETLYQQIMLGNVNPPPATGPKPIWLPPAPIVEEMERTIPLAGRKQELVALQDQVRVVWQGKGKTILLAGEAGVGKTRLAYELLRSAAMFQMTSLLGAAYEQEENLPYQPFIEAFDRYLAERDRSQEENPITHYKPTGSNEVQQEHTALFKTTADFLITLADRGPIVLLLDDLHAADEASLGLFHYLARHTRTQPIVLLATYRTDVTSSPTSPFGRLLNALYREQLSEVMEVGRLRQPDSAAIITHVLGGDADPALIDAILEITEGNPFFTQEISRALLKKESVFKKEDRWQLRLDVVPPVPSQLRGLLRERVQRLGPTVEPALTAAAVIGREFRFPLLRSVAAMADHELLDALDAALDGYLLEETEEGYRFRHSLIRHTLYDALSRARRRWLHTRVAEAIEALSNGCAESLQPHVEALAFHYNQSDYRERALPYLLQAGQKAMDIYALQVARDHFEQALVLMDQLNIGEPGQQWQALELLGRCTYILADIERAVACFEQALAIPPTKTWQPEPDSRLQLRLLAAFALTTVGDINAADRHLEDALTERGEAKEETSEYAYLWYNVAMRAWHRHEYEKAFAAAQRSLEIASHVNDPEAIARAYEMLALTAHSLGEWQQGLSFEAKRALLMGQGVDVTWTFDAHL